MVGVEGEERFKICKHKFGTPPRSIKNSNCSGRDNFFVPCHCATIFYTLHNMLYFHISTFRCKFIIEIGFNNVQFVNMASILSIDQTMSNAKKISFKSQEVVEIDCIQTWWHTKDTKLGSRVKCIAICVFFWGKKCKVFITKGRKEIHALIHSSLFRPKFHVES